MGAFHMSSFRDVDNGTGVIGIADAGNCGALVGINFAIYGHCRSVSFNRDGRLAPVLRCGLNGHILGDRQLTTVLHPNAPTRSLQRTVFQFQGGILGIICQVKTGGGGRNRISAKVNRQVLIDGNRFLNRAILAQCDGAASLGLLYSISQSAKLLLAAFVGVRCFGSLRIDGDDFVGGEVGGVPHQIDTLMALVFQPIIQSGCHLCQSAIIRHIVDGRNLSNGCGRIFVSY